MNRGTFALLTTAALAVPSAGRADTITFPAAITRLFTARTIDAAWFAPNVGFPAPAVLQTVLAGFVATLGPYQSIAPNGDAYTLTFARGTLQAQGTVADGAFTSLLFNRMQCKAAADRIAAIFTTDPVPAAWFDPRFLAAISIDKIRTVVTAIRSQNGAFTSIAAVKDGSYDVTFAHGHVIAQIDVDANAVVQDIDFLPPAS